MFHYKLCIFMREDDQQIIHQICLNTFDMISCKLLLGKKSKSFILKFKSIWSFLVATTIHPLLQCNKNAPPPQIHPPQIQPPPQKKTHRLTYVTHVTLLKFLVKHTHKFKLSLYQIFID